MDFWTIVDPVPRCHRDKGLCAAVPDVTLDALDRFDG